MRRNIFTSNASDACRMIIDIQSKLFFSASSTTSMSIDPSPTVKFVTTYYSDGHLGVDTFRTWPLSQYFVSTF